MNFFKKTIKNLLEKLSINRGDINLNTRKGAFHKAWGYIFSNHIVGDYIEFGVYKGDSFYNSIIVYLKFRQWFVNEFNSKENWRVNLARKSPLNQLSRFHGLDTFEGMPENNEKNIIFEKGNFNSNIENVNKKIKKIEIDYKLYKGNFNETKNSLKKNLLNRKVAIINFDCDIQKSTDDALEIIKDKIDIGTILMFDDYNSFKADNNQGQRKSFANFSKNENFIFEKFFSYEYVGQCFLTVDKKD